MYCSKCGKELQDRTSFCSFCGHGQKTDMPDVAVVIQKLSNFTLCLTLGGLAFTVAGVLFYLFLNTLFGGVFVVLGVIVLTIPMLIAQRKLKWKTLDRQQKKSFRNQIKRQKGFRFNAKMTYVAGAVLILVGIGLGVTDAMEASLPSDLRRDSYGTSFIEQMDTLDDLKDFSKSDTYRFSQRYN